MCERGTAKFIHAILTELGPARYKRTGLSLFEAPWIAHDLVLPPHGLAIRTKTPRRRRSCRYREARPAAGAPNEVWAMDFVSDALFNGRRFRMLSVVDCHTREAPAIVPR